VLMSSNFDGTRLLILFDGKWTNLCDKLDASLTGSICESLVTIVLNQHVYDRHVPANVKSQPLTTCM